MKISRHIDWLSITLPAGANWRAFVPIADWLLKGQGRHGYSELWIDRETKATVETESGRQDMGSAVTLSGDVLLSMRQDMGIDCDTLVRRIAEYHGRVSRVDLAIDCRNADFNPKSLSDALVAHNARISARKWRFIAGHNGKLTGDTVDTASPKSDRRFRFYDKRAEQVIKDPEAWVRLEVQLRRAYARGAVGSCLENGVEPTITGIVADYLRWDNADYRQAIAGPSAVPPKIARKGGKRAEWLLSQVAVALAQECVETNGFRQRFIDRVDYLIGQKLTNSSMDDKT